MKCLMTVFIVLILTGCDIEDKIRDASQRCEDEFAKIIQNFEGTCLTKDELFDIIDAIRDRNNQTTDCAAGD